MMCLAATVFLALAQEPTLNGTVLPQVWTIEHVPLPIIINGKRPEQANQGRTAFPGRPEGRDGLGSPSYSKAEELDNPVENIKTFNPEQVELEWSHPLGQASTWQLRCDGMLLRDFGSDEAVARQVLLLIRQLRINQYGSVGQDRLIFEYWLRDGRAPEGIALGLSLAPVDQATLAVEKGFGQWAVRDVYRTLIGWIPSEAEARQALAILRKYRFTQMGVVGSSDPPVVMFLSCLGDVLDAVGPGQGLPVLPTNPDPNMPLFTPPQ